MVCPAMNETLRALLASLLAFDTTSRVSNLALIQFIDDYLTDRGITTQWLYDDSGKKANLYARLGPEGEGGVMLSGHTDVVPVEGQNWSVPPFALTERDGRYYGRGSADMKGFIACVLAMLDAFLQQPLRMPLHLAFSCDEEVGCLGVRALVAMLNASPAKPAMCIVGEPTAMQPVYGHKGKRAVRCRVQGHACHSAYTHQGVNAVHYAARLIAHLLQQEEALKQQRDERFEPPYSTLQIGTIQGGTALNIVPETCQFDMEWRTLPGTDAQALYDSVRHFAEAELVPEMQRTEPLCNITFQPLSDYPGLLTDPQTDFARWLAQWSGHNDFATVAFGTEGGLFDEIGVATLVCGPGSMEQGHKADEFVSLEQLECCMAMLQNLRQWMAVTSTNKATQGGARRAAR
ncbi:acetylornithine deacetylase [Pantoea stewartii subsp. indologenes]|uniref:acetylornithine deacetylase n=1 Tax=Pantoea stewartii TaxID=66269 RepID=UPI003FA4889A